MKFLLSLLTAIAIALATGLGSVWLAVGEGLLLRPVKVGNWSVWPGAGQPNPDPYSAAVIARTGQVPLGPGEGWMFVASRDSAGAAIRGGCDYVFKGTMPDTRLWTLSAVDAAGNVSANPSGRYALTSREIVSFGRAVEVELAPGARPGNWLPIAAANVPLTVVLRLYDPQGIDAAQLPSLNLPQLVLKGCAS